MRLEAVGLRPAMESTKLMVANNPKCAPLVKMQTSPMWQNAMMTSRLSFHYRKVLASYLPTYASVLLWSRCFLVEHNKLSPNIDTLFQNEIKTSDCLIIGKEFWVMLITSTITRSTVPITAHEPRKQGFLAQTPLKLGPGGGWFLK
jgi:hypothetical protein